MLIGSYERHWVFLSWSCFCFNGFWRMFLLLVLLYAAQSHSCEIGSQKERKKESFLYLPQPLKWWRFCLILWPRRVRYIPEGSLSCVIGNKAAWWLWAITSISHNALVKGLCGIIVGNLNHWLSNMTVWLQCCGALPGHLGIQCWFSFILLSL